MRHIALFTIAFLISLPAWAQQTYRGRVVAAGTGEPLPYASVYVSEKVGTLTNLEGNFTIETDSDNVLRISYIGYEPQRIKAAQFPGTVVLKPMTTMLREVTVVPVDQILLQLIKKLNKEQKRHAWQERNYFFRLTSSNSDKMEVMEAFLKAYSAVTLRDIGVLNGKYYRKMISEGVAEATDFIQSNLHQLLQLGPLIPANSAPEMATRLNLPLPAWARERADLSGRSFSFLLLTADGCEDIYKIRIDVNPLACAAVEKQRMPGETSPSDSLSLSGTLFIEKRTLTLLAFDGELKGFAIREYHQEQDEKLPASVHIYIDYDHSHGFTEPRTVQCSIKYGDTRARLLAFRVKNARFYNMLKIPARNNLLFAIQLADYDPSLWKKDIIQRTEEEERIVRESLK